jgi:hypothetical protein
MDAAVIWLRSSSKDVPRYWPLSTGRQFPVKLNGLAEWDILVVAGGES